MELFSIRIQRTFQLVSTVVRETKVDNLYCKAMECWQKGRGKNIKKVCCAFARQTFNSL